MSAIQVTLFQQDAETGLDSVWREFKEEQSPAAKDRLIIHYAPLVKYVAGRLGAGLPPSVDQGDLVSAGVFGLIDALDKYDVSRGVKFEAYAISRIRGAILDELRKTDWVPRHVRSKARRVEDAQGALQARLGRRPTDGEMAQHLHVTTEELRDTLSQISRMSVLSLEATPGDSGTGRSLLEALPAGPGSDPASDEGMTLLGSVIEALTKRERTVIGLYYFEGLTLAEIGDVLGVTESRVCQIHTQAVGRLRESLTDLPEVAPSDAVARPA
jgi:RNA polymerase sigma factor for flagellar operon FliA